MKRILAIRHPEGGTSGVFHAGAADAGCVIEEWCPAEQPEPPRALEDYAALVVLGGDQNVSEQDRFPYLTRELEILEGWLAADRPVLAVCLGAQLLAHASGGGVPRLPERQLGWLEIERRPAGVADPILGFGPGRWTAFEWHSYGLAPAPEATILATSATGVEAFRLGRAWGVQFHPEVDADILGEWLEDLRVSGGPERRRDAAVIRAGMAAHLPAWNAFGRELLRRFAHSAA